MAVVIAVAQVQSLAWEILHTAGMTKKKKKKKKILWFVVFADFPGMSASITASFKPTMGNGLSPSGDLGRDGQWCSISCNRLHNLKGIDNSKIE